MKQLLACLAILAGFNLSAQWNDNADVDQDGCVGVCDVLEVLSVFGSCEPVSGCVSPTMDGYTYNVVEIGIQDQCWFAENLRTTVYGNGDAIPASLTNGEWFSTTSGATAVYGEGSLSCSHYSPDIDACEEAQSLAEYGRLYNWYAVDDARGLCPSGWHVPTDEEWTALEFQMQLEGYNSNRGTVLKSTYGWNVELGGINGTDDLGFSGLAGGVRSTNSFVDAGIFGGWWSSSPDDDIILLDYCWSRNLLWAFETVERISVPKSGGYSIRCRKDAQ